MKCFCCHGQILINIKLMFKVKFVVRSNSKQEGGFPIRVVGNLPELGNWNPLNSLQLQQFDPGEWESAKPIEIPNGQQFEFKLVKILPNHSAEWEELPNNSNRKFKPKFHTKLVLKWSNHIGQALNQAKSSLKFKGLPGVMVNGQKEAGMLKRKPNGRKKDKFFSNSDSDEENQNDSFQMIRKKSTDIRESISADDIQQIYYATTELQNAYQHYKQIQVSLVSSRPDLSIEFVQKIEEELKQLYELENFKFKWLLLSHDQSFISKFKKISFKKIDKNHDDKVYLEEYAASTVQKCHFIIVDIEAALKSVVGSASACLYLSSTQFDLAIKHLKDLEKFRFICFDRGEVNKKLFEVLEQKKTECQLDKMKQCTQKLSNEQSKVEKNFEKVSIQRILQELEYGRHEQTSVNTVQSLTKNETLSTILKQNSILLIDSDIMKVDKKFFNALLDEECEKRLIIILHKGSMIPEWIENFSCCKNVCVILDNFSKLYFVGKLYDPGKKHRNAMEFIQMRAKLFEKQIGGEWSMSDNCFTFKFKEGTISKALNIKTQIENVLMKDYDYFKFYMKQNKLKITWNLSHPIRLLRTLIRIKFIEEGLIGNFYIVSHHENVVELKEQLLLLIMTNSIYMVQGKNTPVFDFGYGGMSGAKYSIKNEGIQNSESTGSTASTGSKGAREDMNREKLVQFLENRQTEAKKRT